MPSKHPDAPFTYNWPMPSVAVDIILTAHGKEGLEVLLIRRGNEPHKDKLALPGGFLDVLTDKTLEDTVWRELEEETKIAKEVLIEGLVTQDLQQTVVLSDIDRDPRGRVISVVHLLEIAYTINAVASDDARPGSAQWIPLSQLPAKEEFAFEHKAAILESVDYPFPVNVQES